MDSLDPLSAIVEQFQRLSKSKHDDSMFTGREFVDEYGIPGQPLDSEPNRTIATIGGDVQYAYSKLHSVYSRAQNVAKNNQSEFKIKGEADQSLNTTAVTQDLEFALDRLDDAIRKSSDLDLPIAETLAELQEQIRLHKQRIEDTGMVVIR